MSAVICLADLRDTRCSVSIEVSLGLLRNEIEFGDGQIVLELSSPTSPVGTECKLSL